MNDLWASFNAVNFTSLFTVLTTLPLGQVSLETEIFDLNEINVVKYINRLIKKRPLKLWTTWLQVKNKHGNYNRNTTLFEPNSLQPTIKPRF